MLACGRFMHCKQDMKQHLVLVAVGFVHHPLEHPFKRLVEAFNETVGLRVVH